MEISMEEICKKGYRVIVQHENFTEVQGIHYGICLIKVRYSKNGIEVTRPNLGQYSPTDKKLMKSVWQEWEKIPTGSNPTQVGGAK